MNYFWKVNENKGLTIIKRNIATLISILAVIYYIIGMLVHTDFSNRQALITFLIFIFPYVFKDLLGGYFLMHSFFRKAKDVDDSNFVTLISIVGANLSIFVGLFSNLQTVNPNENLIIWGTVLSLVIYPFYFVGLFSLGYNLTILPEANSLNTKGIYSISRHPLYLCYTVWYVLQNLICQTWIMLFISIIQIALQIVRAKYEEKILEKNFSEYKEYKESVWWIGCSMVNKKPIIYENVRLINNEE